MSFEYSAVDFIEENGLLKKFFRQKQRNEQINKDMNYVNVSEDSLRMNFAKELVDFISSNDKFMSIIVLNKTYIDNSFPRLLYGYKGQTSNQRPTLFTFDTNYKKEQLVKIYNQKNIVYCGESIYFGGHNELIGTFNIEDVDTIKEKLQEEMNNIVSLVEGFKESLANFKMG